MAVIVGGPVCAIDLDPHMLALVREKTVVLGRSCGSRTELRMTPEQVRTIIEPGGFRLERVLELPPYHYGAVFRKTGWTGEKT